MAGWTTKRNLICEEIKQRGEEGVDIAGLYDEFNGCGDDEAKLDGFYKRMMELPVAADFAYNEPNSLDEINKLLDGYKFESDESIITPDKFYGAWLGRCAGCALGKPLETGYSMGGSDGRTGYENVRLWFTELGEWPIKGYTPKHSPAEEKYNIHVGCPNSTREDISFMETDDDIRYTVLGLIATEMWGQNFSTIDIGNLWLSKLGYYYFCTAERQAYLNFCANSDIADITARIEHTRTWLNPYREWIGAQIRVDAYGYAGAGNPSLAAKMAYTDAALSHVKNGIYGAMLCAAMISAAFGERDTGKAGIMRVIKAGLSVIPKTSRLYADVTKAIEITEASSDTDALIKAIYDAFKQYHPVHTNNNAALCVAALLHSEGDYEKAITTAVSGGWDTDCNGATVGSVMGALLGADNLPSKWMLPLHDTLFSEVIDFNPIAISQCSKRSYAVYKKILG